MRLALTKRLRRKTNQRVRPLSFRLHRLPRFGLWAQAAACLARAALVAPRTVLAIPMVDEGATAIAGERRESVPAFTTSRHRAHARAATALSPAVCHVVDRYPPPSYNHHLGCLGGKIATRPTRARADRRTGTSRPSAARAGSHVPKIQLPNLVTRASPSLVTQNKQSLLTGREVRDAKRRARAAKVACNV